MNSQWVGVGWECQGSERLMGQGGKKKRRGVWQKMEVEGPLLVTIFQKRLFDEEEHWRTKGQSEFDSASRGDSWCLGKRINECSNANLQVGLLLGGLSSICLPFFT